jgi:GNAT superfamily N-acetyltransferase
MKITEIHKLAEKQKWMNRFLNSYSGSSRGTSGEYYGTNVRFFLATNEKKSLGFVRINDKASQFNNECPFPVWNLTDGYVKLPYRSNGVLKQLIEYVVKECDVRMMYLETERFSKNRQYYQSLGFNNHFTVKNGELTWAFQDDVWHYVVERKKQSQ